MYYFEKLKSRGEYNPKLYENFIDNIYIYDKLIIKKENNNCKFNKKNVNDINYMFYLIKAMETTLTLFFSLSWEVYFFS